MTCRAFPDRVIVNFTKYYPNGTRSSKIIEIRLNDLQQITRTTNITNPDVMMIGESMYKRDSDSCVLYKMNDLYKNINGEDSDTPITLPSKPIQLPYSNRIVYIYKDDLYMISNENEFSNPRCLCSVKSMQTIYKVADIDAGRLLIQADTGDYIFIEPELISCNSSVRLGSILDGSTSQVKMVYDDYIYDYDMNNIYYWNLK